MVYRKDTLAYQLLLRPGTVKINRSKADLLRVAKACSEYKGKASKVYPEHEAIDFYLTNHSCMVVREKFDFHEPLGEYLPIVNEYQNILVASSVRMFYYILLICVRESRHASVSSSLKSKLIDEFGDGFVNFRSSLSGSSGAVERFLYKAPQGELGKFTEFLVRVFYKASFSSGYGGPAWGAVADCLNEFVHGRYSAEMMMDTSFTLCHNNGPIFNKGMLFNNYNGGEIKKILDVQRSGQIPQLVTSTESSMVTPTHGAWIDKYGPLLGDEFNPKAKIDWVRVKNLGALGNYSDKIKKQLEEEKVEQTLKGFTKSSSAGHQESKGYYIVMPGVKVEKVKVRQSKVA